MSEHATPREIGWAVGIGAFAGCTPALGFHGALAVGLATLFRKSRLFAYLGSRISNMVFLPFIALAAIQVSHRARTGAWVDVDSKHVLEQFWSLLLDWCLGTIPVGLLIGIVTGMLSWALATARERRRSLAEDGATTDSLTSAALLPSSAADAERAPDAADPATPPPSSATS